MNLYNTYGIKTVAITLIVYGAYKSFFGATVVWGFILHLFYASTIPLTAILWVVCVPVFFNLIIPIFTTIGGIQLFKFKKSGWIISIIVSLLVFTISFAGVISMIISSYFFKDIPLPPVPKGTEVEYISMIPTYITTIVSFCYILYLRRTQTKELFIN